MIKQVKHFGAISLLASSLLFSACTQQEEALAVGATAGALLGEAVYDSPHHYKKPHYYHNGRYYYGGRYKNGVYYHHGVAHRHGHYFNNGNRYHNGVRYRARVGEFGYYENEKQYRNRL